MFASLLFLILLLMIINLAPDMSLSPESLSSLDAFFLGIGCYLLMLILIVGQNRFFKNNRFNQLLLLVNFELLLFSLVFHFFLGSYRLYWTTPLLGSSYTLLALVPLTFYFLGLYLFYKTSSQPHEAGSQVRFLLPFCLPFLCFDILIDLSRFAPIFFITSKIHTSVLGRLLIPSEEFLDLLLFFAGALLFLILIMIFFPAILQKLWGCQPLPSGHLRERLDALCKRLKFHHAGMKTWPVMKQSMTAGVIGVVSKFRYVMFTEGLIHKLPPAEVEAVLAHEIGHSRHFHLLLYPFIIFGMGIALSLASIIINIPIEDFFGLLQLHFPDSSWVLLGPIALFVVYALIVAIYFRYVFGLFSRNFERQADLHVLVAGIDGKEMINALDRIAVLHGNIHKQPNWHHFSIQERIQCLREAMHDPKCIRRQNRKVYFLLVLYLFFLKIAVAVMLAPYFPNLPVSDKMAKGLENSSAFIDKTINQSLRENIAKSYVIRYHLQADPILAEESLKHSLSIYPASQEPGAAEFYAAQILLDKHDFTDSAILMTHAWLNYSFPPSDPSVLQDFEALTQKIITQAEAHNSSSQELKILREVSAHRKNQLNKL